MRGLFEASFAGIPYEWYRRNDLVHYEGCWAALTYSHFAAAGLDVRVEEMTSHGRLDMAVVCPGHVHLYGFKVVNGKPEGRTLERMRERGHADRYRDRGVPIRLVGVEFGGTERNITAFSVEDA